MRPAIFFFSLLSFVVAAYGQTSASGTRNDQETDLCVVMGKLGNFLGKTFTLRARAKVFGGGTLLDSGVARPLLLPCSMV